MQVSFSRFLISKLITVLMLVMLSQAASAQEVINLFAHELKERLSIRQELGYNKLLNYILQDINDRVVITITPIARTSRNFAKDPSACVYPSNEFAWRAADEKRKHVELISSLPIDMVSVRAFTLTDQPLIRNVEGLHFKNVGYMLGSAGYSMLKNEKNVNFFGIKNEELLLKMLKLKRIDVILGFSPDILMATDRLEINQLHFDEDFYIFNIPVHVLCKNTANNQELMKKINIRLGEAHSRGLMKKFLGPHSLLAKIE